MNFINAGNQSFSGIEDIIALLGSNTFVSVLTREPFLFPTSGERNSIRKNDTSSTVTNVYHGVVFYFQNNWYFLWRLQYLHTYTCNTLLHARNGFQHKQRRKRQCLQYAAISARIRQNKKAPKKLFEATVIHEMTATEIFTKFPRYAIHVKELFSKRCARSIGHVEI